ncbi:MAG: DNA-binding protein [Oscillospiraceae bacterium]
MRELALAFDTSNYTTSCAVFDGADGENSGRLLEVKPGELGLRQSDALFSHVKRLPDIFDALHIDGKVIAVGASEKPRETEDSYMPCFLAGVSQAKVLARLLNVPYFGFSHQQGHIAAAAWSSGHMELLGTEHLAWHLSGGTTELLYVRPEGVAVRCEIIGGTKDVSAGQLIDRTGQALSLQFPSGKALDALSKGAVKRLSYRPKPDGMSFSLSGVEHKMHQMIDAGSQPEEIAYFSIASMISAVKGATDAAKKKYGDIPVLYSGGVASNSLLREMVPEGIFAEPRFSTDNAMGTAILTMRAVRAGE